MTHLLPLRALCCFSRFSTYSDKPSFGWHIGRASTDTELGLQSVEVRFQASLLLSFGWLGLLRVATELLKVGLESQRPTGDRGRWQD